MSELSTKNIRECIRRMDARGGKTIPDAARAELAALVANQIPGRCKDCDKGIDDSDYIGKVFCKDKDEYVDVAHYCGCWKAKEE